MVHYRTRRVVLLSLLVALAMGGCDGGGHDAREDDVSSFTLRVGYFSLVGREVGCLYSTSFRGIACAGAETSTYHFRYLGPAEEEPGSFTVAPPVGGPMVTFRRSFVRRARGRLAGPEEVIRCDAVRVDGRVGLRCRNADSVFTLTRSSITGDALAAGY